MKAAALALLFITAAAAAEAQPAGSDGWRVSAYPIFVWIPAGIDISVELPPDDGGGGGSILDGRFDGAYFGGLTAQRGRWRFDADGIWAGFGGDRLELPQLVIDADLIYFHTAAGFEFAPDLYVTGGLRRVALQYNVALGTRPEFERKPGVWDPLVGVAWHRDRGEHLHWHAGFEAGGFGAGSDVDLAGMFRLDWKPWSHFGVTAGYHMLYLKVSDGDGGREFVLKQTLHGPLFGIGVYF